MPETQDGSGIPSILERIVRTKRAEVSNLMLLEDELVLATRSAPPPEDFVGRLREGHHVAVIAEVKRRSPGAGPIREDLDPVELAEGYARGGAAALSVLTDRSYFGGSLDDLRSIRGRVGLPLLRKDFIVHPIQLLESRGAGADAVLLIVRILDDESLVGLLEGARRLGMAAVVEVHDAADLERALAVGARVIGVNNRDLSTFETSLQVTLDLAELVPGEVTLVSESGLSTPADVDAVGAAGVDAVLIGEALVRSPSPEGAVAALSGASRTVRALV